MTIGSGWQLHTPGRGALSNAGVRFADVRVGEMAWFIQVAVVKPPVVCFVVSGICSGLALCTLKSLSPVRVGNGTTHPLVLWYGGMGSVGNSTVSSI